MNTPAQPSSASGWTRWFTRISVLVGAAALVATILIVGPRVLWQQIVAIGPWFALIFPIECLVTGLDAAAIRASIPGHRVSLRKVAAAQVAGRAVNAVTPLASLGEVTKVTLLMEEIPSVAATTGVLRYNLASLAYQLTLIAIGAPAVALAFDLPSWAVHTAWIAAGLALAAVLTGVLLLRRGLLRLLLFWMFKIGIIPKRHRETWRLKVREIDHGLERHGGISWQAMGLVVASRLLSQLETWIALAATGYFASLSTMVVLASVGVAISWVATLVPMGLGVSEGGNAALFRAMGEPHALGVSMVFSRRVVNLAYAAIGLAFFTARESAAGVHEVTRKRIRARAP